VAHSSSTFERSEGVSSRDRGGYADPRRGSYPRDGDQLMVPQRVTDQAPVPPPADHRLQATLGAALHIDALTLVRPCTCPVCAAWQSVWLTIGAILPCPPVQVEPSERPARNPCCSLPPCARSGSCPLRICMTGCRRGLWVAGRQRWPGTHSESIPPMEKPSHGGSASVRVLGCPHCLADVAFSADRGSRSDDRDCSHACLRSNGFQCRLWSRSGLASSSLFPWIPRSYVDMSGVRYATLFSSFPSHCS